MRLNVPPDRPAPRSGGPQPADLHDLSAVDRDQAGEPDAPGAVTFTFPRVPGANPSALSSLRIFWLRRLDSRAQPIATRVPV
jgi:hypothetical protein